MRLAMEEAHSLSNAQSVARYAINAAIELQNSANTLTFTVKVKECIARAGLAPGVYNLSLRTAGESVTGGEVSAVRQISVQLP